MVAIGIPDRRKKAPRSSKEVVDSLSLDITDYELDTIKVALQSVFEAAVELDTFLAEADDNESSGAVTAGNNVEIEDDDSFAAEERRLHESELLLRQALESVDDCCSSNNNSSRQDAAFAAEALDKAVCDESYQSPESQVPLLQAVSPFDSPISVSDTANITRNTSTSRLPQNKGSGDDDDACFSSTTLLVPSSNRTTSPTSSSVHHCYSTNNSPTTVVTTAASVSHSKDSRKRQIRPYGLRPHKATYHESVVDVGVESFEEQQQQQHQLHNKRHSSMYHIIANALFGRAEYVVQPLFFSKTKEVTRTLQGTVSVWLSFTIVIANRCSSSNKLSSVIWPVAVLVVVLPLSLAFLQAKLPHTMDETTLAAIVFGTHVALSHLSVVDISSIY